MSRADDDVTFGFGADNAGTTEHGEKITVRRNNMYQNTITFKVEDLDEYDDQFIVWLTLDEAEALAYRLLYAVNRIKEDADGQA